jgi:lactoylglutathione lyase
LAEHLSASVQHKEFSKMNQMIRKTEAGENCSERYLVSIGNGSVPISQIKYEGLPPNQVDAASEGSAWCAYQPVSVLISSACPYKLVVLSIEQGLKMNEILGINHIGVRVRSLETARHFYERLGFKFLVGPIGREPVAIMEHPSGVNINLILNADSDTEENVLMDVPEKHPGYTHFALTVSDISAVEASIRNLGILITEGPITLPEGGIMFFIRDQDRNVIEFHQNA